MEKARLKVAYIKKYRLKDEERDVGKKWKQWVDEIMIIKKMKPNDVNKIVIVLAEWKRRNFEKLKRGCQNNTREKNWGLTEEEKKKAYKVDKTNFSFSTHHNVFIHAIESSLPIIA